MGTDSPVAQDIAIGIRLACNLPFSTAPMFPRYLRLKFAFSIPNYPRTFTQTTRIVANNANEIVSEAMKAEGGPAKGSTSVSRPLCHHSYGLADNDSGPDAVRSGQGAKLRADCARDRGQDAV